MYWLYAMMLYLLGWRKDPDETLEDIDEILAQEE